MDEVAGLLREVIARPDDDDVRAVLADVLQHAGDPRGELISLQLLASRGNRDRDDRIHELLRAHGTSWLGSLRDAAYACRFDRGFPSRLVLGSTWPSDDPRWELAITEPALATVEDLLPGPMRGEVYRRFLGGKNLRRIEVYDRLSLEGLADTSARIEHVSCPGFTTDDDYARYDHDMAQRGRFARGQVVRVPRDLQSDLPAIYFERLWATIGHREPITSIGIEDAALQQLFNQRWYPRIRTLTIAGSNVRRRLSQWDELGQRHLVLVPNANLEPCERRYPWDFRVEVIPSGDGAIARISGEWMIMPLAVLEALPTEVTRVEIEQSSPVITDRMRDHVARPGVEVVEVPLRADNFVWEIR